MEKPMYQHFRCDGCVYLGTFHDGASWNDLYHCPSSGTLIARWGDDFDDYYATHRGQLSLLPEAISRKWPSILEADRRASR
jgi:hypothetical protein